MGRWQQRVGDLGRHGCPQPRVRALARPQSRELLEHLGRHGLWRRLERRVWQQLRRDGRWRRIQRALQHDQQARPRLAARRLRPSPGDQRGVSHPCIRPATARGGETLRADGGEGQHPAVQHRVSSGARRSARGLGAGTLQRHGQQRRALARHHSGQLGWEERWRDRDRPDFLGPRGGHAFHRGREKRRNGPVARCRVFPRTLPGQQRADPGAGRQPDQHRGRRQRDLHRHRERRGWRRARLSLGLRRRCHRGEQRGRHADLSIGRAGDRDAHGVGHEGRHRPSPRGHQCRQPRQANGDRCHHLERPADPGRPRFEWREIRLHRRIRKLRIVRPFHRVGHADGHAQRFHFHAGLPESADRDRGHQQRELDRGELDLRHAGQNGGPGGRRGQRQLHSHPHRRHLLRSNRPGFTGRRHRGEDHRLHLFP